MTSENKINDDGGLNNTLMCDHSVFGIFAARKEGVCLKISIPGKTENDWGSETEFIDLPLMDKGTFEHFVNTISKFKRLYDA